MTYYVDPDLNTSGLAQSETATATTVESTHPGSDDAVAPQLPAHAYGSRGETTREQLQTQLQLTKTKPAAVAGAEEQQLSTIQEQTSSKVVARVPQCIMSDTRD